MGRGHGAEPRLNVICQNVKRMEESGLNMQQSLKRVFQSAGIRSLS